MTMVMSIEGLLSLPWTIVSNRVVREGTASIELTVEGVPGFLVYGTTDEEAEKRFWPSFRLFLQSYLDDGEQPPLPAGIRMGVARRLVQRREVAVSKHDDEAVISDGTNTARSPALVKL